MKSVSRVLRRTLLLVPLTIQSGILNRSAVAQSRNVDDTFLVDARVNGFPAVLLLDTGAEHSLLDRKFAQRLGLHPVAEASLQRRYSSEKTEIMLVTDLDIQSVHSSDLKVMTDDLAGALDLAIETASTRVARLGCTRVAGFHRIGGRIIVQPLPVNQCLACRDGKESVIAPSISRFYRPLPRPPRSNSRSSLPLSSAAESQYPSTSLRLLASKR
jgi:hypothetical protein